jgi:hypothetical protein
MGSTDKPMVAQISQWGAKITKRGAQIRQGGAQISWRGANLWKFVSRSKEVRTGQERSGQALYSQNKSEKNPIHLRTRQEETGQGI